MNWAAFFSMGGYGLYVWMAYGAAALVLVFNVMLPWRRNRVVREALREFYRTQRPAQ